MKLFLFAGVVLIGLGASSALGADDGVVEIFNGRDLVGWAGGVTNGTYAVDSDGTLKCIGRLGWKWRQPRNIWTTREYTNFIFRFECRLTAQANHGIGIRCPEGDYITSRGMEIQILEDESTQHFQVKRKLAPYNLNASIYGVVAARRQSYERGFLKPLGEWNEYEIRADGPKVTVKVNGETVVETDLSKLSATGGTPDGKPHPGIRRIGGHLTLCWHNDDVWFRNLRIKEL